ncbi:hypothetical protein WJ542_05530 [Paraburkholderia sp. B3]|uniref:hypothetical protein n=1 Tax=Paraburkholderia sp. B3 TaxID=3134791 RepID=UPI003981A88D
MAADNGDTLTPVSQWAYPFPQKNATGTVNPDAYLAALQGSDGSFPLGLNGLWHGGIHLDQTGTSSTVTDSEMDRSSGVRCIADGEVVAYRLDSDYQHLSYPDKSTVLYSRSFTLVKHKLTLPAVPANNSPTQPSTVAPAKNEPNKLSTDPADSLVFFSLYMHLAPCTVYQHSEQDKNKKTWPSYYNAEPIYTVNAQRAKDKQEDVKTGEPVMGSHVHRDNKGHAGESIGILRSGSKVRMQRLAHAPKHWGRIASVISGEIVPIQPGKPVPPDASHGWVFLDWLDSEINPAALDSVYVLPEPVRISAGDVVGYLGEYQNAEHASPLPPTPQRALLHVEVFAGDDLQAFLARSRARAAQLTQEPKTQLVLSKGANLYGYKSAGDLTLPANTAVTLAQDASQTGMWTKVQVKAPGATSATNYWIARSELASTDTRRAWNSFPLSLSAAPSGTSDYTRVVNIAGLTGHMDDQKHTWYEVDAGDANMNTVDGFVCASGQPNVSLQNKWAWAGFELLSSSLATVDLYRRYLYLKGDKATSEEQSAFEAGFNVAKSNPLIEKLDEILTPKTQPHGRVQGQDLLSALNLKWRASRVDHLVVKYESEWGGKMTKWDALDPFMHDGLPYWTTEKERIQQLQMWDACKEVLKPVSTPSVYHLHPVGIVGNFFDPDACACGCCLNKKIQVVRWNGHYGPCYWGSMTLANAPALQAMQLNGEMTASESRIIAAMAPNEGKLDTVQSYDDQVITAGAMQKTMRPSDGGGEFAQQVADFRAESESGYQELFAKCGWTVVGAGDGARLSFAHPEVTGGQLMTGANLRERIRDGCDKQTNHQYLPNPAVAAIAHAISDLRFQKLQIKDFVSRLRKCLASRPTDYDYSVGEYFQGDLGRATVLDQSVNRPAFVDDDLATSLNHLYATHPTAPRNPNNWGPARAELEQALADQYGTTRRMAISNGVSVAPGRYNNLKSTLQ